MIDNIMFVMPEIGNMRNLARLIEKELNCSVVIEHSITDAMHILSNFSYSLVICDTDYCGIDLFKYSIPQPFLFLSYKRYNFLDELGFDYILKPYRVNHVLSKVKGILNGKR